MLGLPSSARHPTATSSAARDCPGAPDWRRLSGAGVTLRTDWQGRQVELPSRNAMALGAAHPATGRAPPRWRLASRLCRRWSGWTAAGFAGMRLCGARAGALCRAGLVSVGASTCVTIVGQQFPGGARIQSHFRSYHRHGECACCAARGKCVLRWCKTCGAVRRVGAGCDATRLRSSEGVGTESGSWARSNAGGVSDR